MTKQIAPENKEKSTKNEGGAGGNIDVSNKYNKLKKRYKYLREEYTKVLESWELGAKSIKSLLDERRFLKKKLDTFFKSQNFIDEKIFKGEEQKSGQKKANVDLTSGIKSQGNNVKTEVKKEANDIQIIGNNPLPNVYNQSTA